MLPFVELIAGATGRVRNTPVAVLGAEHREVISEMLLLSELDSPQVEALFDGDPIGAVRVSFGLGREIPAVAKPRAYDLARVNLSYAAAMRHPED